MSLLEEFLELNTKEKLISEDDKLLLGISTGPDSTCLLYLLLELSKKIPITIGLAYINYQLRPLECENEILTLQKLSSEHNLKLHMKENPITNLSNIQNTARQLRFDYFQQISQEFNYNKVLLSHHLDDQIETFLMRLFRGSSLKSLIPMTYKSNYRKITIIRPLLNFNKRDIFKYLNENNITYNIDSSNVKNYYLRNKIRNQLIPLIETLFPTYKQHILHTIYNIKEYNNHIKYHFNSVLKTNLISKNSLEIILDINLFKQNPDFLQRKMIVQLTRKIGSHWHYFTYNQLDKIINRIYKSNYLGTDFLFHKKDINISIEYNKLIIYLDQEKKYDISQYIELEKDISYPVFSKPNLYPWIIKMDSINNENLTNLKNPFLDHQIIMYIDSGKITNKIILRPHEPGERIIINNKTGSQKIKDVLINQKIPLRKRKKVILICDGSQPIALISFPPYPLLRLAQKYFVDNQTKDITRILFTKNN